MFFFLKNEFPIVLIHGFMGWGPGEMGDYNYWGGKNDYVELFRSEGFNIIEVSRACFLKLGKSD